MAITQVRAQINGTWYTLTATGTAGQYTAQITAPGATSYNQPGGYYNVTVEATNTAGTTGSADASTLEGLKFYVEERVAPVITILSPSDGAYVSNNQQPVVFTVTDESGGSGVDLDSVAVRLDGTAVSAAEVTHTAITNGYSFTYTPSAAMGDGAHTVSVEAADNDGNAAAAKSTTFTVDTVPPALNVTSPAEGLVTATAALAVSGTTNDATSSPVVITVTLNSADQGPVTVQANGAFSKTVTLAEGANTIVVTATDAAGKVSTVTRNVTLDTSVPQIVSASVVPNPADAGATVTITVTVVRAKPELRKFGRSPNLYMPLRLNPNLPRRKNPRISAGAAESIVHDSHKRSAGELVNHILIQAYTFDGGGVLERFVEASRDAKHQSAAVILQFAFQIV